MLRKNISTNVEALSGFLPEELIEFCSLKQKFRANQIFRWISDGVKTFDDMTNISLQDRKVLSENFCLFSTRVANVLKDPDGTIKLAIELFDGAVVETVLLFDKTGRKTACVSCQAGCPVKCAFCKTGQLGFLRNLLASEIVEQFFHLEVEVGKLDNIVFMGMGEPMLNLSEIRKAFTILTHPNGRNLSKRRITISTSGICAGIYEMADFGPDVRLAVSLTVANQHLRESLMPVAKANSLSELKKAVMYFCTKSKRRVTFELALMHKVNTSKDSANELINFVKGIDCHINLIPWNPVAGINFTTPTDEEVNDFNNYLEKVGLNITIRQKRGQKIGGACGQLGSTTINK